MIRSKRKNQLGQTLLEVVIALATAIVVISAMAVIVVSSLNNAQFSKNQNQATQYAQQGIEFLKNLSDTDWASFAASPTGNYCLSPLSSKLPEDAHQTVARAGTGQASLWTNLTNLLPKLSTRVNLVQQASAVAPIRFYLPSSGSPVPAITPAFDSGWEATVITPLRLRTHTTKTNTAMSSLTFSDSDLSSRDILFRQYISDPIQAVDIINPTIKFQIRASEETGTAQDMFTSLHVRVVQADGSPRGTVLAVTRDDVELTLNTPTNRQFATTSATTVNAQYGDRLVFEIGTGGDPSSYGHDSEVRIGDLTSAADLPESDSGTTDLDPWIEVSTDIRFTTEATPTPTDSPTPTPTSGPTPTSTPGPTPTPGPYSNILIPRPALPTGCGQNVGIFSREVVLDQFAAGETSALGSNDCLPTNVARAKITVSVGWSDNKCTNPSDIYCHKIKLISCAYNTPTVSAP